MNRYKRRVSKFPTQSWSPFPGEDYSSTRPLSTDNNRQTGRNIRKRTVDLYIVTSVFIASYCGSGLRRSPDKRNIFSAVHPGRTTRPISRNGIFETRRCPESNNTESSFNKGLATIYRHTSHSHLSASTPYIVPPYFTPSVLSFVQPPPTNPFHFMAIVCRRIHTRLTSFSLSLYRLSIRKYFFSQFLCVVRARSVSNCGRVCVKGAIFLDGSASLF